MSVLALDRWVCTKWA